MCEAPSAASLPCAHQLHPSGIASERRPGCQARERQRGTLGERQSGLPPKVWDLHDFWVSPLSQGPAKLLACLFPGFPTTQQLKG